MNKRRAAIVLVGILSASGLLMAQAPSSAPPSGQAPAGTPGTPSSTDPATPAALTPAQVTYAALVERVKREDSTVDLSELREAFTETPAYRATMMAVYQSLWTPLNRGDFPAALLVAEKVLEGNYVEINAHMVASVAQQQLGNAARAQYHRNIANGLLRVVMSKGDGQTRDTPWIVIDISEEYAVMRALGLSMQTQGLSMSDGVNLDIIGVVDSRTKESKTIYFNVNRSMAAMSRSRR